MYQSDKIKLSSAYGILGQPPKKLSDDDLIFWLFYRRDAYVALRNWQNDCPPERIEALKKDILDSQKGYEELLAEVKDRMRKGGNRTMPIDRKKYHLPEARKKKKRKAASNGRKK